MSKITKQHTFIKDSLWNQVPIIGAEGLIATIEDKEELLKKLKEAKDKERAIIDEDG